MSEKHCDTVVFAYDKTGVRYLVTQEYFRSGGSYYASVSIRDKFYEIDGEGEDCITSGTPLPMVSLNDYGSYFYQPTAAVQKVLEEAGLADLEIDHFFMVQVHSLNTGPYRAEGFQIYKGWAFPFSRDLSKRKVDNDLVTIVSELLQKYEHDRL